MAAAGQDMEAARQIFTAPREKAIAPISDTRFRFEFLASPVRIEVGCREVCGLEVEDNTLIEVDGITHAQSLGTRRMIPVDNVIFCIGDGVDQDFCLPIRNREYIKVSTPRYPIDDISYEAYDGDNYLPYDNVFLAGWARQASTGLVGLARKDGENAAEAMLQYLAGLPPMPDPEAELRAFEQKLESSHPNIIRKAQLARIEAAEQAQAEKLGLPEYKFGSNEEMLRAGLNG